MAPEWVSVDFAGPETWLTTSLCTHCPRGEAGCCAAPPPYSLAEIGRVAATPGGPAWLAAEVAAGRLLVREEVLQPATGGGACVYWRRGQGCTLEYAHRPAQCNFFICGEALQAADVPRGEVRLDPARRAHTDLLRLYDRWHRALLSALGRLGLTPLRAERLPELCAALAHWWPAQAPQWRRVEPNLPGEGRYTAGDAPPSTRR